MDEILDEWVEELCPHQNKELRNEWIRRGSLKRLRPAMVCKDCGHVIHYL